MRILMLTWEYPPHVVGGMGKHVMDLAPALVAEGFSITIMTPQLGGGPAQEIDASGARIVRVPVSAQEDSEFIAFVMAANREMELAALALQQQEGVFNLIHVHDWLVANAGVGLKRLWRIPLISTIHATERGRGRGTLTSSQAERINSLEWWLTYESWCVIVCSRFMENQIHDYFRTPADKTVMIPNGIYINPDPFPTQTDRQMFRHGYALDDQPLVFFVGRIVYEKGPSVLLAAWPQVRAQHNAILVVAGTGAYLETVKAQAVGLGVSDSVLFTGFISDQERDKLYRVADVAVFPSLYEAFGIVALEAMAAHCPVVVSDTGGLAEVVDPHQTGITVIPEYSNSLAWGINHTLENPAWAASRADNAFRVVSEQFHWPRIAGQTGALYRRVHQEWLQVSWGKEIKAL